MSEKQETIADIINEIRRDTTPYSTKVAVELEEQTTGNRALLQDAATCLRDDEHYIKELADRIEAARERERGNVAAMREAVERVKDIARREWAAFRETAAMKEMFDICEAALSAPPRNCDVGTAEEQSKRCFAYCNQRICKDCPCNTIGRCTLIWAQLPYESAAKEGEKR